MKKHLPPGKKPNLKKSSPARKALGKTMAMMMKANAMSGGGMQSQTGTSATLGSMA